MRRWPAGTDPACARRRGRGNLEPRGPNSRMVGHTELSIADIEFVGSDAGREEIVLDDIDVIVLDEHRPARQRAAATRAAPLPGRYSRVFDDAQTRVWAAPSAVAH